VSALKLLKIAKTPVISAILPWFFIFKNETMTEIFGENK
jgi:hypothetical protein